MVQNMQMHCPLSSLPLSPCSHCNHQSGSRQWWGRSWWWWWWGGGGPWWWWRLEYLWTYHDHWAECYCVTASASAKNDIILKRATKFSPGSIPSRFILSWRIQLINQIQFFCLIIYFLALSRLELREVLSRFLAVFQQLHPPLPQIVRGKNWLWQPEPLHLYILLSVVWVF